MTADVSEAKPAPVLNRGAFYRLCRQWHGYLSAFAFVSLIFFSVTGILLNHPDWFASTTDHRAEQTVTLGAGELKSARVAQDPAKALAALAAQRVKVRGAYASGEVMDEQAILRFEGVTGSTDVDIDLATGRAQVSTQDASVVQMIGDLHRGKNAGAVWKAGIDIVAGVILALSLVGYILFFSLRFRLATSIVLTILSVAAVAAIFVLCVP